MGQELKIVSKDQPTKFLFFAIEVGPWPTPLKFVHGQTIIDFVCFFFFFKNTKIIILFVRHVETLFLN
jgi:hypothetical protein